MLFLKPNRGNSQKSMNNVMSVGIVTSKRMVIRVVDVHLKGKLAIWGGPCHKID